MNLTAGSATIHSDERHRATVAVDVGFASRNASTGLAWSVPADIGSATVTFGNSVSRVAELLQQQRRANLILEAPLSSFFSSAGNPVGRREFEVRAATEGAKAQHRYWYTGAGASTLLASIFFLRGLEKLLPGREPSVALYEGFISFKRGPTCDRSDAEVLRGAFLKGDVGLREVKPQTGESLVTVIQLIGGSPSVAVAPPILMV